MDIPVKLAVAELDVVSKKSSETYPFPDDVVETLAELEHRRWAHFEMRNARHGHQWNIPWDAMTEDIKEYDRDTVRNIPKLLATHNFEIVPARSVETDSA